MPQITKENFCELSSFDKFFLLDTVRNLERARSSILPAWAASVWEVVGSNLVRESDLFVPPLCHIDQFHFLHLICELKIH